MQHIFLTTLFAQANAPANGQAQSSGLMMLLPIVGIGVLFYFLVVRPQRQEQRKREALLAAVKKNDRVVTIGGIFGVVTNVDRDHDEVTIKVDESNNTKLRTQFSAIAKVIGSENSDSASSSK